MHVSHIGSSVEAYYRSINLFARLILFFPEGEHISKHLATALGKHRAHQFTALRQNTQTYWQPLNIILGDWLNNKKRERQYSSVRDTHTFLGIPDLPRCRILATINIASAQNAYYTHKIGKVTWSSHVKVSTYILALWFLNLVNVANSQLGQSRSKCWCDEELSFQQVSSQWRATCMYAIKDAS